ncbi:hypothetical protein CsatB_013448 [Cannabis sativa]
MLKSLSYSITYKTAFGNQRSDHGDFISLMKDIVQLSAGFAFGDLFPSLSFLDWYTIIKLNHLNRRSSRIVERIIKSHIDQDKEIKSPQRKVKKRKNLLMFF